MSDQAETNGWCNALGCFQTDSLDADSDDDGLSDGKEKLYETHPLDSHSPGLYVEYEDHLATKQYFSWQRFGNKYIALPTPGKDSAVVRRGSTFSVGAPANAQVRINRSTNSLTILTATRNVCSGRWDVVVPADGTVGIYTIRAQDGTWSKTLKLYVIFQWPEGLDDAFVDNFVYDDDPASARDTSAIDFFDNYTPEPGDPNNYSYEYTRQDFDWIPRQEWIAHGWLWDFNTQHYTDFVFQAHVMPTINGETNTWDAANALGGRVDDVTCFGSPRPLGNSKCVLNPGTCAPYTNENQCSNIASLLTAFNRAAGIPARPVFADWLNDSFDHSTEVWTKQNQAGATYNWYVMRGYAGSEGSCPTPTFHGGIRPLVTTSGYYTETKNLGVFAAGPNWSSLGGKTPTRDQYRMASWDFNRAAQTSKVVKKPEFETRYMDYWGWPAEPQVTGTPPTDWPSLPPPSAAVATQSTDQETRIRFEQVVADRGVDLDGDGRFDQLVFDIELEVLQAGDYWIRGTLGGNYVIPIGGSPLEALGPVSLAQGRHTVQLPFDGMDIYMTKTDGPFTLASLWITDVANPTKSDFAENSLDYVTPGYQSAAYRYTDFGVAGATLSGEYQYQPVDTDGDGHADALRVETNLNVERPDTFTVRGALFDDQENMLSEATWTGSGPQVTLQFEGLKDSQGPYSLQHVHVRNAADRVTDGMIEPYPLGEIPQLSAKPILLAAEAAAPTDISATFVITNGYSASPVDTDGDGKYNQLTISVAVRVEAGEGGQAYRLEGWLVDQHKSLVAWAISDPRILNEGVHTLPLIFDGSTIHDHGVDGPFTLVALKALPGYQYQVLSKVDIAYTTPAYAHDDFEQPATISTVTTIFEDHMENGAGPWSAQPPWTLSSDAWYSYSHAWKADASGPQSGSLSISLNASQHQDTGLRFKTCYDMRSTGDVGYVEASNNGVDWTRVATYTSSTAHWSTQFVDLRNFAPSSSLQLRFNARSQNDLLWYVDDVTLYGWSDTDLDGLSDAREGSLGTNPNDPDSDDDGLLDGEEVDTYHTGPLDADSDDDGMPDGWEVNHGLDPLRGDANGDLDNDGLTNRDEYNRGTNPANVDTDSDGMPDKWEVDNRLNPLTNDATADPDNDGLPNGDEYTRGTNPQDADTDDDTLKDGKEVQIGTLPNNQDSDGDGIPDGVEVGNPDAPANTDATDTIDALDGDSDNDGISDATEWDVDQNSSTADNLCANLGLDTDGDGIPNCQDNDADGDGKSNYRDLDSDGDGSPDIQEGTRDNDGDHIPNYLDPDPSFNEWIYSTFLPMIRK